MAVFPGATPPAGTSSPTDTLVGAGHTALHNTSYDEIRALATKLGTGSSTATAGTVLRGTGAGTTAYGQVILTTDVTGSLPIANGGIGQNSLTGLTMPSAVLANPTITGTVAGGATYTSPTLTVPTVASFTNAQHNHTNAAGGGSLGASTVGFTNLSTGATYLGYNFHAGSTLTASYVTHATVTATSTGGKIHTLFSVRAVNGNSGALRTMDIRVQCDGATVEDMTGINLAYLAANNPEATYSFMFEHQPSAGSHTWTLQLEASAGAAVVVGENFLNIAEVV